jgi:hypothetical protein
MSPKQDCQSLDDAINPLKTQTWHEAKSKYPNLKLIMMANRTIRKQEVLYRVDGRPRLKVKKGIVYQLEVPKATIIRQLKRWASLHHCNQ